MIVYHGTTNRRARRICVEGFLPRKPSGRVWFAESRAYALGRAKTQARRSRDRPVVLACDIDIHRMRNRYGAKRILHRKQTFEEEVIALPKRHGIEYDRRHVFD